MTYKKLSALYKFIESVLCSIWLYSYNGIAYVMHRESYYVDAKYQRDDHIKSELQERAKLKNISLSNLDFEIESLYQEFSV